MKKIILLLLSLMLFQVEIYAQTNNNQISWSSLGIGIHNKGEITDWTYFGTKSPYEASLWIDALKPLGGISYAGATRLWKHKGFTVQETKEWVRVGAKTPESAKRWTDVGIETAIEVKKWQKMGITEPWQCESWKRYVGSPEKAKEWMDEGFSVNDVGLAVSKGYRSPAEVRTAQEAQKKQSEERVTYADTREYMHPTEQTKVIQSNESYAPTQNTFSAESNEIVRDNEGYQVFLLLYFVIMIVTMFKGYGDNRTVIIFRDYNDLGLTFLIPASFVLIYMLFMMFGGNPAWGAGLAFGVSLILFGILAKNTYVDNNRKILPTILSLMTKMPLGIIWILSFMTMLNPSGKTAKQKRQNRASALMIMAILTPIIGMLIVSKEGSMFNPKEWIKGRRIGGIRNHL